MTHRLFTEDHEWVQVDGDTLLVGISAHAVDELGEIVYVELPEKGDSVVKGEEFGSVESVKTVSGLYAPVNGVVLDMNQSVIDSPELINQSPYGDGWLLKLNVVDLEELDGLMDESQYNVFLSTL